MKKWLGACVLGVCLTVLPMPALAVHWMSLGSSEEGEILMDRDSLKRPADTSLTVWEKVLWPQSDAHGRTGELRHREYDMKGKKWRQLSSYQLDARGRKTAGNRKIQEWQEFQPMTSLLPGPGTNGIIPGGEDPGCSSRAFPDWGGNGSIRIPWKRKDPIPTRYGKRP